MGEPLQLPVSIHQRLDDRRTPIDGSPCPSPPSMLSAGAIGKGDAQITMRHTGGNVLEHIELAHMVVDDIVSCCVPNECSVVPRDDDACFIQHREGVLADTGCHGDTYVCALSLQPSSAPYPDLVDLADVAGNALLLSLIRLFQRSKTRTA